MTIPIEKGRKTPSSKPDLPAGAAPIPPGARERYDSYCGLEKSPEGALGDGRADVSKSKKEHAGMAYDTTPPSYKPDALRAGRELEAETLRRKQIDRVIGFNAEILEGASLLHNANTPRLFLDGVEIAHSGLDVKFRVGELPVITVRLVPKSLHFVTDGTKAAP